MQVEEFIEHHGVKGMKWGIRNKRSRVKSARKTLPPSHDFKKTAELRKRKKSQLTNKQLDAVNARLNKEQNFSRLNPSTVHQGQQFVKSLMAVATTATTAYLALTKTKLGQKLIEKGNNFIKDAMNGNKSTIDLDLLRKF